MMIKKVFSRKLALELRRAGARIVDTKPNWKKPQFDVYLFEDNEEFQKLFTEVAAKLWSN